MEVVKETESLERARVTMIEFTNQTVAKAQDWAIGTTITVDHPAGELQFTVDENTIAVIFDMDGNAIDLAENLDTAISYVNSENSLALIIKSDDSRDVETLQSIVDNEALLRADCFGYTLPEPADA